MPLSDIIKIDDSMGIIMYEEVSGNAFEKESNCSCCGCLRGCEYSGLRFRGRSAIRGGTAGDGQHLKTVAASGGYEFKGWALNGNEVNLYQPGDDVEVTADLADGNNTLTFKAVWEENQPCIHTDSWTTIIQNAKTNPEVYEKCLENGCTKSVELRFPAGAKLYNTDADEYTNVVTSNSDGSHTVKYAVSVYGIRQDKDQAGNPIGLTFGPATGENYTDGYKCHTESDSKVTGAGDGDGAAVLYDNINYSYRRWNKEQSNIGGWPGSRIRATLNGADQYTADGSGVDTGGGKIYYSSEDEKSNAGTDVLQEPDALISAFPAELRDAIVPKAVISDTKYNDYSDTNYTFTTYDKLWLFSGTEVWQDAGTSNDPIRPHEGIGGTKTPYDRAVKLGISTKEYGGNAGYEEDGAVGGWWLRSLHRGNSRYIYYVSSDDDWGDDFAGYYFYGLSAGFCVGSK